jgi:hypothetical protein
VPTTAERSVQHRARAAEEPNHFLGENWRVIGAVPDRRTISGMLATDIARRYSLVELPNDKVAIKTR